MMTYHLNFGDTFWKTSHELLRLCNHCWNNAEIPKTWRLAKVVLLFKKGDATLPENYRPISLLPTGYKVLAALIHQRLLDSGVDEKYAKHSMDSVQNAIVLMR